jgi:surface polysaccharide O-acyltransferase-like enzyme
MNFDRTYLVWSLCYAVLGMGLGIYMAASHNHAEFITHAHLLLVGFVVSFIYGTIHKLWLVAPGQGVAKLQFVLHQASAITMIVGLFLLFANMVPAPKLEPILASASIGVLLGMLLMIYMVIRFRGARRG